MGYTHYWYRDTTAETPEMFGRFALGVRSLTITAEKAGIAHEAHITEGDVLVHGEVESFYWPAVPTLVHEFVPIPEGISFAFCKTNGHPYDALVTAILLRARDVYGETLKIESDGSWDDWADGRALYRYAYATDPVRF